MHGQSQFIAELWLWFPSDTSLISLRCILLKMFLVEMAWTNLIRKWIIIIKSVLLDVDPLNHFLQWQHLVAFLCKGTLNSFSKIFSQVDFILVISCLFHSLSYFSPFIFGPLLCICPSQNIRNPAVLYSGTSGNRQLFTLKSLSVPIHICNI